MAQDNAAFKRLKIDRQAKMIPLKSDKRGTYPYRNEIVNPKRSLSSGFISRQKPALNNLLDRRVQSMDTKNIRDDTRHPLGFRLGHYRFLENITNSVWDFFVNYNDNNILHDSIDEDLEKSDTNKDSQASIASELHQNKLLDTTETGSKKWNEWQPSHLPLTKLVNRDQFNDSASLDQPYGSSFLRNRRNRNHYNAGKNSPSAMSLLHDQSDEINYLKMIFNKNTEIPMMLQKERQKQLDMMERDRDYRNKTISSIRELTSKIKSIWINKDFKNPSYLSKRKSENDELIFLKEQKTEKLTPTAKTTFTNNLKFQRYLSSSIGEKNLNTRYERYEDGIYDYKRKYQQPEILDLIPSLSSNEIDKITEVFKEQNDRILNDKPISVNLRDFKTLNVGRWINDTIVEFYMIKIEQSCSNLIAFNSFFYENLSTKGYTGVRRWMKRKKVQLIDLDKILIPINLHQSHWVLGVIDMKKKSIMYIDSLSQGPNTNSYRVLEDLQQYIIEESKGEFGKDFKLTYLTSPQQQNGFDCGIYLCLNSIYMSKNMPLSFGQKEANKMRLHLGKLILNFT